MWYLVFTPSSKCVFMLCLGAHSHIRGLGLDDALEPRQVALSLHWHSFSKGLFIDVFRVQLCEETLFTWIPVYAVRLV